MQAALHMLGRGRANTLIVVKLDRLSRSLRDMCALVEDYFADERYHLLSVCGMVNTHTAAGRVLMMNLANFSQFERDLVSERTRDALQHLKAQGVRLGHAPYGYEHSKQLDDKGHRILAPLTCEQAVIARMAELFAGGGVGRFGQRLLRQARLDTSLVDAASGRDSSFGMQRASYGRPEPSPSHHRVHIDCKFDSISRLASLFRVKHNVTTLMRRLAQAGFKKDFVQPAIFPDWWAEECEADASLLPDIEIRIARFLGLPLSSVRDPGIALTPPTYVGAQLRRVRDINRDRLGPAIHTAIRIAGAVVRSLRSDVPSASIPPTEGVAWREQILEGKIAIKLDDVLRGAWQRGIPVVAVDVLPSPRFQGLAAIVEGRPVILLGHRHDEPSHAAFVIAHEGGHIAAEDCTPGHPVVDEMEEAADDAEMEKRADEFATRVLVGAGTIPDISPEVNFRELASQASKFERASGVDAGAVIFAWARRTGDYAKASMAVKALYRASGAQRAIRQHFDRHVDLNSANESDRALLRCVHGDPERDETAD